MGKGKKPAAGSDRGDRVVYSEFSATARPDPLERGGQNLPPGQQSLRVSVSRKGRGGKVVTVITGFVHPPTHLMTLAKQLKAHCGSGGTAKEDTVEIQGDHATKVMDYLQKQGYGVKRSGG